MPAENILRQLAIQSLALAVIGVIVYVLTKASGFRYQGYSFTNPKQASLYGFAAILGGWLLVSAFFLMVASSQGASQIPSGKREYGVNAVVGQAIIALIAFGPALLAMRWRKEPWASAGISRYNFSRALIVGLLLDVFSVAGIFFSGNRSFSETVSRLTISHFWALLHYAIVGFGEEFAFRGYLQTRMVAWLGTWQGWIVTSVLMALAHIVQRVAMMGLSSLEAVLSSASLIPISLLMGYVMLRTENVIAPGLFHTFADWVNTLS